MERRPRVTLATMPPWLPDCPPLGLACLAAYLRACGVPATVLDLNILCYDRSPSALRVLWQQDNKNAWERRDLFQQTLESLEPHFEEATHAVLASKPDLVGLSVAAPKQLATIELVSRLREAGLRCPIVLGGPACLTPQDISFFTSRIPGEIACFAIGEGEETLAACVDAFVQTGGCSGVAGTANEVDGSIVVNAPRLPVSDLDALPLPGFEEFPLGQYAVPSLAIEWSRGCVGNCAFCQTRAQWKEYRKKSPGRVVQELDHYVKRLGIRHFSLCDSAVNGCLKTLEAICQRIVDERLELKWTGCFIGRPGLSRQLFRVMRLSGCYRLDVGLESGSAAVTRNMRKPGLPVHVGETLRLATKEGIETHLFVIVGFPGETEEQFGETLAFLSAHRENITSVRSVNTPFVMEGTDLRLRPERYGIQLAPYGDSWGCLWTGDDGSTIALRNERVERTLTLLRSLEIPCELSSSDDLKSQWMEVCPTREESSGGHAEVCAEASSRDVAAEAAGTPDIVLCQCPAWGLDTPPLGIACLVEFLQERGVAVTFMDFNKEVYRSRDAEIEDRWRTDQSWAWFEVPEFDYIRLHTRRQIEACADGLIGSEAPVVGFSVARSSLRFSVEVAERVRRLSPERVVVFGGPSCSVARERQLIPRDVVDYVVVGEGEHTLYELMSRLQTQLDLSQVPGLVDWREGQALRLRPPELNLSRFPFPRYRGAPAGDYSWNVVPILWSRGCVRRCAHCGDLAHWKTYRARSVDNTVEELLFHQAQGRSRFCFVDLVLGADPPAFVSLCERLAAAEFAGTWSGRLLPSRELAVADFELACRAGCRKLTLCLPSCSQGVLDGLQAGLSVEQADHALRCASRAGIATQVDVVVGYPGEDSPDFVEGLQFLERNKAHIGEITCIRPCAIEPHSRLERMREEYGIHLPVGGHAGQWHDGGWNNASFRTKRTFEARVFAQTRGLPVNGIDLPAHVRDDVPLLNEMRRRFDRYAEENAKAERFAADNLALAALREDRNPPPGPDTLEIELSSVCTANCIGCWCHSPLLGRKEGTSGEQSFLSFPTVKAVLEDAAALGVRSVQLTGAGEPTLHPQFDEILVLVKDLGFHCNLVTNVLHLTPQRAELLVQHGVNLITASLWAGSPETYRAVHPNLAKTAFETVTRNLRHVSDAKREAASPLPHVKLYHVLCRPNVGDAGMMVEHAREVDADSVEFTPIDIIPGKTDGLALRSDDVETLRQLLQDLAEHPDQILRRPEGSYHEDAPHQDTSAAQEQCEYLRFLKRTSLVDGFTYDLSDWVHPVVRCPLGRCQDRVTENTTERVGSFWFDPLTCSSCGMIERCGIDRERFCVSAEWLTVLGVGSLLRRLGAGDRDPGLYDQAAVDRQPCYVGWLYARVRMNGDVIPCCKATSVPMGNVLENGGSFAEIWNSGTYKEFREKARNLPKTDPYFAPIDCYRSCDNLGMNMQAHCLLQELTPIQSLYLRDRLAGFAATCAVIETAGEEQAV
ncbi:radical SAM protein [Planctomycetota bacterium]